MELQSLKIPQGWKISYNQFFDVQVTKENVEDPFGAFQQDILQFDNENAHRMIDLGWYPMCEWEDGAFGLVVHEGDFLGKELYSLRTRDKDYVVAEINRLLDEISRGKL